MKNTLLVTLLGVLSLFACKKSESLLQQSLDSDLQDYLVLQNGEELNSLITSVSKMSDSSYQQWKKEKKLRTTLYDKYIEAINGIQNYKNQFFDSNFFYIKNEMLYSKNGILLDKILNQNGVIQIGKYILRYQNNNVFYSPVDSKNALELNKKASLENLQLSFNNVSALKMDKEPMQIATFASNGEKIMSGIDHRTTTPQSGQQFNYELKFQEDYVGPVYRYTTWLFENFIIYPTSNVNQNGLPIWDVSYKLYLQYGLQTHAIAGWVNAASSAGLNYFHIESKSVATTSGNAIFEGFYYYPGKIKNPSPGVDFQISSTQFSFTDNNGGWGSGTNFGTFPTWEIYTVDNNVPTVSTSTRGGGYSVYLYTGRFKLDFSHVRQPAVGPQFPSRDFHYEFQ